MEKIEDWMRSTASPLRQPPVSPAMRECITAIRRLTSSPQDFISAEEIAKETGRATPTVNSYLKILTDAGILIRRPNIKETSPGRRVREWVYRLRKPSSDEK